MSTDTYARTDPDTGLLREELLPSGGGRAILRAGSDRADGFVDPSTHASIFSNADDSPVLLEITDPGQWMIGWRGYVRSSGGYARMEADVYISPAGAVDPFAPSGLYPGDDEYYAAFNVIESSSNTDVWLEAHTAVLIAEPSQIAAQLYTNAGAMVVAYAGFIHVPQLFAWPIG